MKNYGVDKQLKLTKREKENMFHFLHDNLMFSENDTLDVIYDLVKSFYRDATPDELSNRLSNNRIKKLREILKKC